MNEKEYMEQRVDDQFNWLESKSAYNQKKYKNIRTLVIIISVLIPLISGFISDAYWWLKIIVGAGGAIVAILEGIQTLNKHQELWLQYRITAEALKREKFLYLSKAGKYQASKKPYNEFVMNIETILAGENASWLQQMSKEENNGDEV